MGYRLLVVVLFLGLALCGCKGEEESRVPTPSEQIGTGIAE